MNLLTARNRIVLKIIAILTFSLVFYGMYTTYHVYNNLLDNNYNNINLMMNVTIDNINQANNLMKSTSFALSGSESIRSWVNDDTYFSKSNRDYYLNIQKLNREMQTILTNNNVWNFELFDYVTVYRDQEMIGYYFTKPFSINQILTETHHVYQSIVHRDDFIVSLPPTYDHPVMYNTLKIQSDFQSDNSIYIISATKEDYTQNKYKDLLLSSNALVYVIDSDGVIFSSNLKEQLGQVLPETLIGKSATQKEVTYQGSTYMRINKKMDNDYRFICLLPKLELAKQAFASMKSFIIMSLLLGILIIVLTLLRTLQTTSFIDDFANALQRVREKDYDTKMTKYSDSQLNELVDTFNTMTSEIKHLIHTTYESKLLLNEMKFKFLQHQMNPHFLFNTLLTIQIKAKMSQDETIYKMIASLSALLRAGIYGEEKAFVPIKEELRYVEFYLSLQKMRYEDKLSYSIDVNHPDILNRLIPRLIIEPIVENAIIHGVEECIEEAHVSITLSYDDDDICIDIIDDGVGFDPSRDGNPLEPQGADVAEGQREKVGLSSTNQRIKLVFGQEYGIQIQSKPHEGTHVRIRIPNEGGNF